VDEIFDSTSISQSDLNIYVRNVGNAQADLLDISDGELVDEIGPLNNTNSIYLFLFLLIFKTKTLIHILFFGRMQNDNNSRR
jgi:hypothetical protein